VKEVELSALLDNPSVGGLQACVAVVGVVVVMRDLRTDVVDQVVADVDRLAAVEKAWATAAAAGCRRSGRC
jgi:hypothetical protein